MGRRGRELEPTAWQSAPLAAAAAAAVAVLAGGAAYGWGRAEELNLDRSSVDWLDDSHQSGPCNLRRIDARTVPVEELAATLARSAEPVLITGLVDAWANAGHTDAGLFSSRERTLRVHGDATVEVQVASLLGYGPENAEPRLQAMRLRGWDEQLQTRGSPFIESLRAQLEAGVAQPTVSVRQLATALRSGGEVPPEVCCFMNVTGAEIAQGLVPLQSLWSEVLLERRPQAERAVESWARRRLSGLPASGTFPPMVRLGMGGTGSGTPWHDHSTAINVLFAGRKRWLIRPRRATSHKGLAFSSPRDLLERVLPSSHFQSLWKQVAVESGGGWECTQSAGEAVFLPHEVIHTIVNLGETVAAAIQGLNDPPGAPWSEGLSALSRVVRHLGERGDDQDGALLRELLDELEDSDDAISGGKIDVNARDGKDKLGIDVGYGTALHQAARADYASAIALLAARGADINAKSTDGKTPLAVAKDGGHQEAAAALVAAGARTGKGKKRGRVP
jgi:hypothetical protein